MDIYEAILSRRTIRTFESRPVEDEEIKEIIKMAIQAPSASNRQAWKFIVINSNKIKNDICSYNGVAMKNGNKLINKAPTGIVVLYRNDVSKNYKEYKDHIQSASAAIQNILLTAHSKGIGTCWICKLPTQRRMRKLLEIPKYYDIIAYVAMGYPKSYLSKHTMRHYEDDSNKALLRKRQYSVEDVISYNKFVPHENSKNAYRNPWLLSKLHYLQLSIKQSESDTIIYKILVKIFKILGVNI